MNVTGNNIITCPTAWDDKIIMTKEEILNKQVLEINNNTISFSDSEICEDSATFKMILNAMDEYSAQLTADNAKKDADLTYYKVELHAANRDLNNLESKYTELKQLADEMAYTLVDCGNIIKQSESTTIGKTYMNVKCIQIANTLTNYQNHTK